MPDTAARRHRQPRSRQETLSIAGLAALSLVVGVGGGLFGPPVTAATTTTTTTTTCTHPYANYVGVGNDFIWFDETTDYNDMRTLSAGGVHDARVDFPWDQIQPTSSTSWDWSKPDAVMTAAALTHTRILAVAAYSPHWASSDPSGGGDRSYPPKSNSTYASFVAAVTHRYGHNGTFWAAHPTYTADPLEAVEIWNEAWGFWDWKPNPNPTAYAAMAHAGAVAVHGQDSAMPVLIDTELLEVNTNGTQVYWLDKLLSADTTLGSLVNGFSVHPYPDPTTQSPLSNPSPDYSYQRVTLIHQAAVNHSANLPLWITEIGWSTASSSVGGVSESTQATYEQKAITYAKTHWSYVKKVFIYVFDISSGDPSDREGNYGLIRADGTYKPAWTSIKNGIATC